jgi:anti-sigma factor RsiW
MMTCEQMTALMNSHSDLAEGSEAAQHMESCPACREAHTAHMALARELKALELPESPKGFDAAVAARIAAMATEAPTREKSVKPVHWPWLAATLGTMATLAATVGMMLDGTWQGAFMPESLISSRLTQMTEVANPGAGGTGMAIGMLLVTAAFLRLSIGNQLRRSTTDQ